MSDYIRREDAIDLINKISNLDLKAKGGICVSLANLQKADVVQVERFRWIKTADGAECENCGREAVYQVVNDHWEYEPWCPHCGAKMDAQREE